MRISNKTQKIADNLFSRLIASGWVKVPPGFKLVPISPSPEQILAGAQAKGTLAEQYRAMVHAAPKVFDGQI